MAVTSAILAGRISSPELANYRMRVVRRTVVRVPPSLPNPSEDAGFLEMSLFDPRINPAMYGNLAGQFAPRYSAPLRALKPIRNGLQRAMRSSAAGQGAVITPVSASNRLFIGETFRVVVDRLHHPKE